MCDQIELNWDRFADYVWNNIKDIKNKYVVCNADEGDPGAFMDRSILEGDPNAILEAMAIAGYAVGATKGYVYVRAPKDHPYATKHHHWIREHRLVMEQHLGRYLLPTEVVHHINGNRQDNRIENLGLFQSNGEHLAHTLKGKCPKWSQEGIAKIKEQQIWSLPKARKAHQLKRSGLKSQ